MKKRNVGGERTISVVSRIVKLRWLRIGVSDNSYNVFLQAALLLEHERKNSFYSLRPIILFTSIDVSRHILVIDTSVFAKSNMDRRE
jgi:hypothetical protein